MENKMSKKSKKELAIQVQKRYRKATKVQKSAILDEFVASTGYNRKYAIRLLQSNLEIKVSAAVATSELKTKICGWVLLRTLNVIVGNKNRKAFNTPIVLKCKEKRVTMLNSYQTKRITQCLNLLSLWRVKDKSPIGNDIQHDSNELLARHQPLLESL